MGHCCRGVPDSGLNSRIPQCLPLFFRQIGNPFLAGQMAQDNKVPVNLLEKIHQHAVHSTFNGMNSDEMASQKLGRPLLQPREAYNNKE
jgi:hypothetical protein